MGKFLSVDPLMKSYPELTPYQFASNSPIMSIDLDGLESSISIYNLDGGEAHFSKGHFSRIGWASLLNGMRITTDNAKFASGANDKIGQISSGHLRVVAWKDRGGQMQIVAALNDRDLIHDSERFLPASSSEQANEDTEIANMRVRSIRKGARAISEVAQWVENASIATTAVSGGTTSAGTVPIVAAAESVGKIADGVSFISSLYLGESKEAMHDGANILIPFVPRALKQKMQSIDIVPDEAGDIMLDVLEATSNTGLKELNSSIKKVTQNNP